MCLAVPGRVIEIGGAEDLRMARIDFDGVVREACLAYVPEAQVGDFVLVHVGFAIATVDEPAAQATLAALRELQALDDEDDGAPR